MGDTGAAFTAFEGLALAVAQRVHCRLRANPARWCNNAQYSLLVTDHDSPRPSLLRAQMDTDTFGDHDEEHSWLPRTPSATNLGLNLGNYFEKVAAKREDAMLSGLTLLDTFETFFDARIDLLERQLKKQREKLQTRATLLAKERREKLKTSAGEYDREIQKFKLKVCVLF